MLNQNFIDNKEFTNEYHCPGCGMQGQFKLSGENFDHYKCTACGYEGSISEDIEERNAVERDMFASYTEGERGEVYDNYD